MQLQFSVLQKLNMGEKKEPTPLRTKLCVAYVLIISLISIGFFAWYMKTSGSIDFTPYEWGPWSSCNPEGYRTRYELCEEVNCPEEHEICDYYEPDWSPWSPCTNLCGKGRQTRFWDCKGDPSCNTFREERECESKALCGFKCDNPMIGDGYCDDRFNLPFADKNCAYDGGDCCGDVNELFCEHCLCLEDISIDYEKCPYIIDLNNGRCNDFANIKVCGYDGGDCCAADANYDFCTKCECIMSDASYSLYQMNSTIDLSSKCPFAYFEPLIGDGFCQPKLNIPECNNDGGDCSKSNKNPKKCPAPNAPNGRCDDAYNSPECNFDNGECCGKADLTKCEECICKDPDNTAKREIVKCKYPMFKGNGKCDDENNNMECDWDGGDCCGCHAQKGFCTECQCKDKSMIAMQDSPDWCCVKPLLNDGICNNENNYEGCLYDGLDCCQEGEECPLQSLCNVDLLKNGQCDAVNDKPECMYDFGACAAMGEGQSLLCKTSLMSDSICDLENSQPQCNFDGGDCEGDGQESIAIWMGIGTSNTITNQFVSINLKGEVEYYLPRFPKSIKGITYLMHDNKPIICGGVNEAGNILANCYFIQTTEGTSDSYLIWRQLDPMIYSRTDHAAALVSKGNSTFMWITGGMTALEVEGALIFELQRSTEMYNFKTKTWSVSIGLNFALGGHCLIQLKDDLILLSGGYSLGDVILKDALLYEMQDDLTFTASYTAQMKSERKFHSCGMIKSKDNYDSVFAVGGIGYDENLVEAPLNTAELYYVELQEWVRIMPLPKNRYSSSPLVISGRIILLGGLSSEVRQSSNYIYNHETGWHLMNFPLQSGMFGQVSLLAPPMTEEAKNAILKQPNIIITHGLGVPSAGLLQLEVNCFRMNPKDTYCANVLTTPMEISATRLGAFAVGYKKDIMVCGGISATRTALKTCDILYDMARWKFDFKKLNSRAFAASSQSPYNDWFITGGFMSDELNSQMFGPAISDTTLIIDKDWNIQEGPTLPSKVASHCMVHVEDRYFMVIGGMDENIRKTSPNSFFINYITGDYMPLPFMKESRANLACIKHYTSSGSVMVIAAGGRTFHSPQEMSDLPSVIYLDTTEIFLPEEKHWIEGPKLPFPLAFASSVFTPKGNWIVGGRTSFSDPSEVSKFLLTMREDASGSFYWELLGYELQQPRHSFNVLSVTTDNIRDPLEGKSEMIPRDIMIPKTDGVLRELCDNDKDASAIFCPSQHLMVITGDKVRDYKHLRGVLIPSNLTYQRWPQRIVSELVSNFDETLRTFSAPGLVLNNLFVVIGGQLNSKVTTRQIAFTEPTMDNYKFGDVQKFHLNGAVTKVGDMIWMVGGRNAVGEVTSRTTLLIDGKWQNGPIMEFNGAEQEIEGMCGTHNGDNIGFIAGGYNGKTILSTVMQYDFSKSHTDTNGWQKLPNIPGGPRFLPSCMNTKFGGKEYIILAGGIEKLFSQAGTIYPFVGADSVFAFDFVINEWMEINSLPKPLFAGTLVNLNSQMYFLGGKELNTVFSFSYEFKLNPKITQSTKWEDYSWQLIDNPEFQEEDSMNFFTDDSVYIPYEICEHCLKEGY